MMWKWVMKGELVENVTGLVIRCYKDFGSPGMGFLDFGILITGILTHLKVISSKWSLFYHRINVFSPCEDSGEVSWAELCHHAWRTSYVPDSLANADWLECLAWATPSEVMLGIFLGINDYFHCQTFFVRFSSLLYGITDRAKQYDQWSMYMCGLGSLCFAGQQN